MILKRFPIAVQAIAISLHHDGHVGKKLDDILPMEVAQTAMNHIRHVLDTDESCNFECQLALDEGLHDYEARLAAYRLRCWLLCGILRYVSRRSNGFAISPITTS